MRSSKATVGRSFKRAILLDDLRESHIAGVRVQSACAQSLAVDLTLKAKRDGYGTPSSPSGRCWASIAVLEPDGFRDRARGERFFSTNRGKNRTTSRLP